MADKALSRWHLIQNHATARAVSIVVGVIADIWMVWFFFARHDWDPTAGTAEFFWLRQVIAFVVYVIIQQWTLANQTGSGDEFSAAFDKFIAITPFIVWFVLEAYWIGFAGFLALTWRHHLVGILWSAYAFTDYTTTDITNQRLRARQLGVAAPAPH